MLSSRSRKSPSPDKNTASSPIKVKDYFTNPLHKIKQSAFIQIGFTVTSLNIFVRYFTNRQNSKYLNINKIKDFVKNFSNCYILQGLAKGNGKLMQMYQQFFIKNFKIKDGMIQVQEFIQFFVKQSNKQQLSTQNLKKIYKDMQPFNAQNLVKKCQYLQVPLTLQQGNKIIKMINYKCGCQKVPIVYSRQITFENFQKALKQSK